mmetsp:Transcript_40300/g.73777  ORF Transcript_40300/g.73777 Transcript_40300/m.73777 type:complete len:158 (+) Transcript_40300:257-730(+)
MMTYEKISPTVPYHSRRGKQRRNTSSGKTSFAHSATGGISNYESSDDGSSEDEKLQKMVAIKSEKPAARPTTKKPASLKGSARSDENSEEGHRLCQFFDNDCALAFIWKSSSCIGERTYDDILYPCTGPLGCGKCPHQNVVHDGCQIVCEESYCLAH